MLKFYFLVAAVLLVSACQQILGLDEMKPDLEEDPGDTDADADGDGDGDGDADSDGDADADTDTDTDTFTIIDTETIITTDSGIDYWLDDACFGTLIPSSVNCNGIGVQGCCDMFGRVIFCEFFLLYCIDCAANFDTCGWVAGAGVYNCGGEGEDPTGSYPIDCP